VLALRKPKVGRVALWFAVRAIRATIGAAALAACALWPMQAGATLVQLPPMESCTGYSCADSGNPLVELFSGQLGLSPGTPVVATPVGPFNNLQPYLYRECGSATIQDPCQTDAASGFEWSFSFGNGARSGRRDGEWEARLCVLHQSDADQCPHTTQRDRRSGTGGGRKQWSRGRGVHGPGQSISPSFFVFNGGPYVAAEHLSGSLLGPASLYPGATTPAKPGETVVLYANGFGTTSMPVVSGSISQSGTLSPLPAIQIGGVSATVQFAGLVAPGEFQFNVAVPASLPNGDQPITATYNGSTTQTGPLITVHQ
jgi:hypothetical protein